MIKPMPPRRAVLTALFLFLAAMVGVLVAAMRDWPFWTMVVFTAPSLVFNLTAPVKTGRRR